MNRINNIYWGIGQKELSASALPSTLESRIRICTDAIARMEETDFPGKAETLEAKRAMLAEMEKAQRYAESGQEQANKLKQALYSIRYIGVASYPAELRKARRAAFIGLVAARNGGGE